MKSKYRDIKLFKPKGECDYTESLKRLIDNKKVNLRNEVYFYMNTD